MATDFASLDELSAWAGRRASELERADLTVPLKRCAVFVANQTKLNFHEGKSPSGTPWAPLKHPRAHGRGGDKPLRDRGLLMASVTGKGEGHIEEITDRALTWGTNLDYAAIHQHGGTITPKNAKALTIPLTKEAWRAGRARNFPGELFVFKSRDKRKAFLAEAKQKGRGKGKYTNLVFHYLLLSKVTIPARPFLGVNDEMADGVANIFGEWIEKKGIGEVQ